MSHILFSFPLLPVSVNKLYYNKGGRRVLSSEGRRFKNKFVSAGGGADPIALMNFEGKSGDFYRLTLEFIFAEERLFNSTYGKDKRVKYRFKDIDATNLVKISEDAISELVGLSDRGNFLHRIAKRQKDNRDSFSEGINALLETITEEEFKKRWLIF